MSLSERRNPTLIRHSLLDENIILRKPLSDYAARKLAANPTYRFSAHKKCMTRLRKN